MKHILILSAVALSLAGCSTVGGMASGVKNTVVDKIGFGKRAKAKEAAEMDAPIDPFIGEEDVVNDVPLSDSPAGVETALPAPETVLIPETAAPPPPPAARTAEALDTTTPEQRAAASAPSTGLVNGLGTTIVSLGSPTEPGLWMKTPLVKTKSQGRVTNPKTRKSARVTLIPIEGSSTAGSRLSLAALRLINASLSDLTMVEVELEK